MKRTPAIVSGVVLLTLASGASAQGTASTAPATPPKPSPQAKPAGPAGNPPLTAPAPGVPLPPDYVIGAEDVLSVFFWRDEDLTRDVVVRPDGKISLPLLNDMQAAGLTPTQLRERLVEAAKRFVENPTATVVVKELNSRKVFITGAIANPGSYPLTAPTTVLQLIAKAGGVSEFANSNNITIVRHEGGRQIPIRFNYKDVKNGRNLGQNIELKPDDTVIVP